MSGFDSPESLMPVAEQVPLRGGLIVSKERYFELQAAAEDLLAKPQLLLPDKIVGIHQLVLRLSRGEGIPTPAELETAINQANLSRNDNKAKLIMSIFLACVLPFSGDIAAKGGWSTMLSILIGVAKQTAGMGKLTINRWGISVGIKEVDSLKVSQFQMEIDKHIEAFWREQLDLGWLLKFGTMFRGAALMPIGTALTQWLIKASAVNAKRPPNKEDIEHSLNFLSSEIVKPGTGFRIALEGSFSSVFDAIFQNPAIVASIANFGR